MTSVLLILSLAAVILAVADGQQPCAESKLAPIMKKCMDQCAKSEDAIKRLTQWQFQPLDEDKCFVKCTLKEMGIMQDDGNVNVDAFSAMFKAKGMEPPKEIPPLANLAGKDDQLIENIKSFAINNRELLVKACF